MAVALVSLNATCAALMSHAARAAVLVLTATCSSIVVWTTSGLENPLTLLLASEILRALLRKKGAYLGVLIAALGMTRPEGVLLGVLALVFLRGRPLLAFLGVASAIFAAFLAFRWATFGDLVPNTFYAKEASRIDPWTILFNAGDLLNAPFGLGLAMVAVLAAALRAEARQRAIPLAMMAVTGGIFALMPPDWRPITASPPPSFRPPSS